MIGYEFEFLVREGNKPLSKEKFLQFHKILEQRGWKPKYDAGTGGLIGSSKNGFFVTSDDGICTMEINTPPRDTIAECHNQIHNLLLELQGVYQNLGCSIIGTSVFPGYYDLKNKSCKDLCVDDQCCEKSYIKYFNAQRFPAGHHSLMVFAAHQVWLDVKSENVMDQWNVFNRLSPILLALFANGPIFNNEYIGVLEGRDPLWKIMLQSSVVGDDTKFFGMPKKPFQTIIEYFDYIFAMPFYFDLRDGKGYKLTDNRKTYGEFFSDKQSEAVFFDGTRFIATPQKNDFLGLQQKTFPHVRIKYHIKEETPLSSIIDAYKKRNEREFLNCFSRFFLECRAISAQPQNDISAGPALLLGIQENLKEAKQIVDAKPYEFWLALYDKVLQSGFDAVNENISVKELTNSLLEISRRGLQKRNRNEVKYLEPLEARLKKGENPSQELLEAWKKNDLQGVFKLRDFRTCFL